jgi:hypothetical protein
MSSRLLLGLLCLGSLPVLLARAPARFDSGVARARAEPSPYLERDNPLRALLPSAAALSARERGQRERAVAQALSRLPHVQRAEVLIAQREPSAAPLEPAPPEYHVQVQLELSAPGPSELEVERVVRGLLPALAPGQLRVVSSMQASARVAAPTLTQVGPFVVARESSTALRSTLAVCLGANALLASLLLLRRQRTRSLRAGSRASKT